MEKIEDSIGNIREVEKVHELQTNISVGYMRFWTSFEAIRELLQNALDEMTELKKVSEMYETYMVIPPYINIGGFDGEVGIIDTATGITIVDGGRGLSVRALVMGESVKRIPSRGRYGEGLKLASLILARNGFKVSIETRELVIRPYIKPVTIGGETVNVLSYKIYRAVADKWELNGYRIGTLINISPRPLMVDVRDIVPIDAVNALATVLKTVDEKTLVNYRYEVINDVIEDNPEAMEPLVWVVKDIVYDVDGVETDYVKEGTKYRTIKTIYVPNMIIMQPGKIYYRDILVTSELKYKYSYDIWSYIEPSDLSRDRKYINKMTLDSIIGHMMTHTRSREYIEFILSEIAANRAVHKPYEEFNARIHRLAYSDLWRDIWEKIAGRNHIVCSEYVYENAELVALLNYNGFIVHPVPSNMRGIIEYLPNIEYAVRFIRERGRLYRRLDDNMLTVEQLETLNDVRKLNDWIFERIDQLAKLIGEDRVTNRDKPSIYAYEYPAAALISRNTRIAGHTDYNEKLIGISASILLEGVAQSMTVYVHELAHYVTGCNDMTECHIEAMEAISGMVCSALISFINMYQK